MPSKTARRPDTAHRGARLVAATLLVAAAAGCGDGSGRVSAPSAAAGHGHQTTDKSARTDRKAATAAPTTAPPTTTATATAARTTTAPPSTPPTTSPPPTTTASTTTTVPPTTTTTLPRETPGWTVVAETRTRIVTDEHSATLPDGDRVTLVRWRAGAYRVDLHFGSEDPPTGGLAVPASAGYMVSGSERPLLIGAFNGGFFSNTGAGGFEADGRVAVPLVAGDASAVIDRNGAVRIGSWGQSVPAPGEKVLSVRQNLQLLIDNGVPNPSTGDWSAWGATLGGGPVVARSALGIDARGDLIYAGSMGAVPSDLVTVMRSVGVTMAMELDINPEWVQADTSARPGGTLSPAIPGQDRPADQYLYGWTRDFFTVLAAGS